MNVHRGLNRHEAVRLAVRLGCHVEAVRRTGEVRITHPAWSRSVLINNRRKDVGRQLVTLLRRLVSD